eukprot:TRINITY_DN13577_c0_g2_i2.p2 TRINITY_DN13577_c0_g2~~TRINITY_DN13577_c0_g2_i2.p2  ORF type:complete len:159 (-),score=42.82 TRINITY_DN13577_c0_g2_i2:86-562(-)
MSKKLAAKLGNFETRMKLAQVKLVKNRTEEMDWFRPKINSKIGYDIGLAPKSDRSSKGTEKASAVTVNKVSKSKLYDSIQSKLQLKNNRNTLISRIEKERVKKERSNYQEKLVKEIGEELECSHKPEIHPMPKYLNRSKNSSEKQTRKSSYSKHTSPN